jgi:hypothetical protein
MSKEDEFYPTPEPLAEYLFERLLWRVPSEMFVQQDENGENVTVQMLEPSAGKGAFAKAMAKLQHAVTAIDPNFDDPGIEGVDWDRISLEELHALLEGERPFDIACGNPPFSLAEAHLRLLLKMVKLHGYIGFLLRVGFLASAKRAPFFQIYPPKHIYVLPKRPSFVWSWTCKKQNEVGCAHKWMDEPGVEFAACPKCGSEGNLQCVKTDQYDYMFAIWEVGMAPGTDTRLTWLNNEGEA